MDIDRYASSVVRYGHGTVRIQCEFNGIVVPCQGFIYGVVDDFINKMVQASGVNIADVHCGAFADMFYAVKYLNIRGCIVCL